MPAPDRSLPEWKDAGALYRILHRIGLPLLKFVWRIHARGFANVPKEGPALIVMNHHSWADGLVLGAVVPRPMRYIGKEGLFRWRATAAFFRAGGVIKVDRFRGGNFEALHEAIAALENGKLVAIYPEATLKPPESRGPYKTGVATLALATGAPVVPVGAVTHRLWPAYKWFPRFGRKVHAVIGEPLRFGKRPEALTDRAEMERVTAEIMGAVHRLHEEAEAAQDRGEKWKW